MTGTPHPFGPLLRPPARLLLAVGEDKNPWEIVWWGILLIAFLMVGIVVVTFIRKRTRDDDTAAAPGGTGFTLTDLRELHAAGKLTKDEYEKAKHTLVMSLKAAADRKANAADPRGPEVMQKDFPPRDRG